MRLRICCCCTETNGFSLRLLINETLIWMLAAECNTHQQEWGKTEPQYWLYSFPQWGTGLPTHTFLVCRCIVGVLKQCRHTQMTHNKTLRRMCINVEQTELSVSWFSAHKTPCGSITLYNNRDYPERLGCRLNMDLSIPGHCNQAAGSLLMDTRVSPAMFFFPMKLSGFSISPPPPSPPHPPQPCIFQ